MCKLTKELNEKSVTGYKAVMKDKDGNFWSSAMGFMYEMGRPVPVVEKMVRLSWCWSSVILNRSYPPFEEEMVGRTSVFKNKGNALLLLEDMECFYMVKDDRQLVPVVVKTVLSGDLMEGKYAKIDDVFAGRVVESMKEVT